MNKKYTLIIVAILLCSCRGITNLLSSPVPKDLSKWQESKFFYGKSTGIGRLINADGYWLCEDSITISPTSSDAIIFYDDGTMGNFYFKKHKNDKGVVCPRGMPGIDLKKELDEKEDWSFGGCYDCISDTICADTYSIHCYWWDLIKLRFEIVNRDTIKLVSRRVYSSDEIGEWIDEGIYYVFVPTKSLPSPNKVSIKRKKWIWDNESDWNAYKQKDKEI